MANLSLNTSVIGVGSPIVDLLSKVDDNFIQNIGGAKGGMELVDDMTITTISNQLPATTTRAAGGSAGNTIYALSRIGGKCSFIGKIGKDEAGDYYRSTMATYGVDDKHFKYSEETPTAMCLSLITPDSERTMRTYLGAAATLSPEEISTEDFSGAGIAHIEGYLLFNPELAEKVLSCAHNAGCKVSLDLGSFEVVKAAKPILASLLENYVDYIFANEDEAEAFCDSKDPLVALDVFRKYCDVCAVKLGADGALISKGNEKNVKVNAVKAVSVDTTGAGDFWAAGFLYGELAALTPEQSGHIGALLGCEVVQQIGADLPEDRWKYLQQAIKDHTAG